MASKTARGASRRARAPIAPRPSKRVAFQKRVLFEFQSIPCSRHKRGPSCNYLTMSIELIQVVFIACGRKRGATLGLVGCPTNTSSAHAVNPRRSIGSSGLEVRHCSRVDPEFRLASPPRTFTTLHFFYFFSVVKYSTKLTKSSAERASCRLSGMMLFSRRWNSSKSSRAIVRWMPSASLRTTSCSV